MKTLALSSADLALIGACHRAAHAVDAIANSRAPIARGLMLTADDLRVFLRATDARGAIAMHLLMSESLRR